MYSIILDMVPNGELFYMFWVIGEREKSSCVGKCSLNSFLSMVLVMDTSLPFSSGILSFLIVEKDTFIMSKMTYLKCIKLSNL